MTSEFADHFSGLAAEYARFRPHYPTELFAFLASVAPGRGLAWDCGTGSGQAAIGLADHFERVRATDPSAEQLTHATRHDRVTYALGRESESGLPDGAAHLVTAAQAAHWFDLDAFYAEVRRVLAPRGIIALWCYGAMQAGDDVDPVLTWFYEERIGRYWPPERALVDAGFATLAFPFASIPAPALAMHAVMSRDELLGYIGTWSAVARGRGEEGADPLAELVARLTPVWPDAAARRIVRWPLGIRAGHVG
ncbi:MAG: class I SAM-dependent methyltransferase [Gemmatimonadales bacterium]